jgi:hypothetical protein
MDVERTHEGDSKDLLLLAQILLIVAEDLFVAVLAG